MFRSVGASFAPFTTTWRHRARSATHESDEVVPIRRRADASAPSVRVLPVASVSRKLAGMSATDDTRDPDDSADLDLAGEVTRMLKDGRTGEELYDVVYAELRALARRRMATERAGHTLQATALVNEVYMRLAPNRDMQWRDRGHFFGAAAEAMRRVLVDHARKVRSAKRGGDHDRLDITLSGLVRDDDPELVLALDEALDAIAAEDARCAEVARLRIYAGFSAEDVAHALDLSPRTVQREWAYARARLGELLATDE